MTLKEIGRGLERFEPVGVGEEAVHFVWKNELLERYPPFAELFHQIDALAEGHVAIIVAVDKKHRRSPGIDGRHR